MSGFPRVLVSACEPSADRYAARVIGALRDRWPEATIDAVGGPHVVAAGIEPLARADGLSAVGFAEIASRLGPHVRLYTTLRRRFREGAYDVVLLLDYPGFHLPVARAAAARGLPVLYYLPPQLWGWGGHRMTSLKGSVRLVAVSLRFEELFFRQSGVPATFVGHPILDEGSFPTRAAARLALGIEPEAVAIALFPGSRSMEVRRLWPVMRDAASLVQARHGGVAVLLAATLHGVYPRPGAIRVCRANPRMVLAAADVALLKCGTVTLEAALAGVPGVITYRLHPASFAVARRVARVEFAGLPNLILGRRVMPEVFQDAATPDRLATELLALLDATGRPATEQREAFRLVRERVGTPGAARRVAELATELVAC